TQARLRFRRWAQTLPAGPLDAGKGPHLRLSRSQAEKARLPHALDCAYQRARPRKRNLVQRADERAEESGRRGRSQDAREERARLASSIEPRRSKRRAPGDHVGDCPRGFLFLVFRCCNIAQRINSRTELEMRGRPTMREQLEEIRRRAMAELADDAG